MSMGSGFGKEQTASHNTIVGLDWGVGGGHIEAYVY